MKPTTLIRTVFLVGLIAVGPSANSDRPARFTILQDEVQELPADNTAFFSAAREVSVQLDLLAAIEEGLDETFVTVIRPNGEETELTTGKNGMVVIDNVQTGPHALVASNGRAHGSTLLYFSESPNVQAAGELGKGLEQPLVPPARMTMLTVNKAQLRPIVEEIRDVGLDDDLSDVPDFVSGGKQFDYRVVLGPDGTLNGHLMSVMNQAAGVSFEGTRIVAFRDGVEIGSTQSDASGIWAINGVKPGAHGLIAAGPAGYAAFSFEAIASGGSVVIANVQGKTFISKIEAVDEQLPVVLIPPAFVPAVVAAIDKCYCLKDPAAPAVPGDPYALPVGGSMVSPSAGYGGGGGGGSSGAGIGIGLAGLAGLAGLGNNNDGGLILRPPVASASLP